MNNYGNTLKTLLFAGLLLVGFGLHAHDDNEFRDEIDEENNELLIEYVTSKRTIDLEDKDCNLTISGDIRFKWRNLREKLDDLTIRGKDAEDRNGRRFADNEFGVEANLIFDYKCDRSWGVIQLQMDNPAGLYNIPDDKTLNPVVRRDAEGNVIGLIFPGEADYPIPSPPESDLLCQQVCPGTGSCDDLCLKKAYFGVNVCADGCSRFDVEVGRRRMYHVFDSRVEFDSNFDGIVARYATRYMCTDLFLNAGVMVANYRHSHYPWIVELGALDIYNTGANIKYSIIDWRKHGGANIHGIDDPAGCRYLVSQIILSFNQPSDIICVPVKYYAAFLINHVADPFNENAAPVGNLDITGDRKANLGWYAGVLIGEVAKAGDWAIDMNYQYVEALTIPDFDVSGIGRCNSFRECIVCTPDGIVNARGNANYKGFMVEGLYGVTDNFVINAFFEYSRAANKNIGGQHIYTKLQIQGIFAF